MKIKYYYNVLVIIIRMSTPYYGINNVILDLPILEDWLNERNELIILKEDDCKNDNSPYVVEMLTNNSTIILDYKFRNNMKPIKLVYSTTDEIYRSLRELEEFAKEIIRYHPSQPLPVPTLGIFMRGFNYSYSHVHPIFIVECNNKLTDREIDELKFRTLHNFDSEFNRIALEIWQHQHMDLFDT